MNIKKENLPVIIALALPVILIIIVGGISLLASRNVRSSHDFVYTLSQSVTWVERDCYTYASHYDIDASGHLVLVPYDTDALDTSKRLDPCSGSLRKRTKDAPDLYIYDSKLDKSSLITLKDAEGYAFTNAYVSPDGYSVDYRYGGGGILDIFGGGRENGIYINKKNQHRQLKSIEADGTYYSDDFHFIGWIR